MSDFNHLKLKNTNEPLSFEKWNGLVDQLVATELKIPDNENGEILNRVTIGTKPDDGKELNYPWAFETVGVSKKIHNLRLQSPNGVYVHTGIGKDENANKSKIGLAITKDGRVGISNIPVSYALDAVGEKWGGMLLSSKENTNATELKLFTQRKRLDQHFWGGTKSNGTKTGTVGMGNKGWMLQAIHSNHNTAVHRDNFRIYFHDDKNWNQALCITAKERNVGLGTNLPTAKLHIIHKNQDANGNALIIGPTNQPNLRLGYNKNYSWIQSHGSKPLHINEKGNDVVVGAMLHAKKGIKFANNSVQSSAIQYQTGNVTMNHTGSWKTSPLGKGSGSRLYTSPFITLKGFSSKPQIMVALRHLDCDKGINTRISVSVVSLSSTRFKVRFHSWSSSKVYQCIASWMAIGNKK